MDYLARLAAVNGTFTVNSTTAVEKKFYGFFVPEDTVIAELYVNDNHSTNVLADYIQSGGTVKINTLKTAQGGSYFSKIKLTSGSVELLIQP